MNLKDAHILYQTISGGHLNAVFFHIFRQHSGLYNRSGDMKKLGKLVLVLVLFSYVIIHLSPKDDIHQTSEATEHHIYRPSDHLHFQRAYPEENLDLKAYYRTLHSVQQNSSFQRSVGSWQTQGPGNAGARINHIAVDPSDQRTIYIGYAGGGIYKTEDGGNSWSPIFDDYPILSIGCLAIDPADTDRIYAGTGDPNITGIPFIGHGIYKSEDAGANWEPIGLSETGIISEIIIHPTETNTIYAAAMGSPFERTSDRGLYKSNDGGTTWTQILFVSEMTGIIDIAMSPTDPNVLFAAGWDRVRNNRESVTYGEGAKIFKSQDAGNTWTELQGGLPTDPQSRIGLAIVPSDAQQIYAVYVGKNHEVHGVFKSMDSGVSWSQIATDPLSGLPATALQGFGWYFGKIEVHPTNPEEVFLLGVRLYRRNPNTGLWQRADTGTGDVVHVDMHDLVFLSDQELLLATDGGLYGSQNGGQSWTDLENIPTTQFYHVSYNPHLPDTYYGGAQDNGSLSGNASDINNWRRYFGGDGFRTIFHPVDPLVYYVETQEGGLSVTNDGGQTHQNATMGIQSQDNINWDAPVILSRHNPDHIYLGTDRLYQSIDGTDVDFQVISPVLTDPIVFLEATSNITAISESFFEPEFLAVGTGDGNFWTTENLGETWNNFDSEIPDRYITSIHHSPTWQDHVYLSLSGFKDADNTPHILRSLDRGKHWTSIAGNLPNVPVNDLFILPNNGDEVLFAGTDAGVFITINAGIQWTPLGNNLPAIPVFDLDYNVEKNELIAATFGKSIVTFGLDQLDLRSDGITSVVEYELYRVLLSPNPVIDFLNIKHEGASHPIKAIISDLNGRTIMEFKALTNGRLDVRTLEAGLYFVSIQWSDTAYSINNFIKF